MKGDIWFCSDKNGDKLFKGEKPVRWEDVPGNIRKEQIWVGSGDEGIDYQEISLPLGFISDFLGYNLEWKDEPLNYSEYSKIKSTLQEKYKLVKHELLGLDAGRREVIISELLEDEVISRDILIEVLKRGERAYEILKKSGGLLKPGDGRFLLKHGETYGCIDTSGKFHTFVYDKDCWDSSDIAYILPWTNHEFKNPF